MLGCEGLGREADTSSVVCIKARILFRRALQLMLIPSLVKMGYSRLLRYCCIDAVYLVYQISRSFTLAFSFIQFLIFSFYQKRGKKILRFAILIFFYQGFLCNAYAEMKWKYPVDASISLLFLLGQVWNEMAAELYMMLCCSTYSGSICGAAVGRCMC